MADGSKIEWTEATWNPITGCSITSPGCRDCYAMLLAGTRMKNHPSRAGLTDPSKAGPVWNGQVRLNEDWLTQPLQWTRPRTIFVCAHGDLFHENVPDAWIDRVFAVMALCPQHTFQVLTKRSARMRAYISTDRVLQRWADEGEMALGIAETAAVSLRNAFAIGGRGFPLPNVWLGVSAEDQQRYEERSRDLKETPAAVHFFSFEPMLGPVAADYLGEWVIVGGESGKTARPMDPAWPRAIRDQCAAANVPFFFKQWGQWAPGEAFGVIKDGPITDRYGNVRNWMRRYTVCEDRADRLTAHSFTSHATDLVFSVGKARAGRALDGVEHNGMPEVRHAG